MPYDEHLAQRIRQLNGRARGWVEKKMFGGVGFLLHGNMCVGVWKQNLIARVGPDRYVSALSEPHVVEFDITGRPLRGWVMIEPEGVIDAPRLRAWLRDAEAFVATLPNK